MKRFFQYILLTLFFLASGYLSAQDRYDKIENELKILAVDNPGLLNKVELSVSGVSLEEFIRSIANSNDLNLSVDEGLSVQIINNFSNVTVSDVLVFLAKKFDLELEFIGNIISISKHVPKQEEVQEEDDLRVIYQRNGDLLSLDLNKHALAEVVKKITKESNKNIILSPEVNGRQVSVFIKDMPFTNAMEKFAFANGMQSSLSDDGVYLLELKKANASPTNNPNLQNQTSNNVEDYKRKPVEGLFLEVNNISDIQVKGEDVAIDDIIKSILAELEVDYYLFDNLQGNKSINLNGASFDDILDHLFESTSFTFKKLNNIYIIGERKAEGLRKTTVYQFRNRSIEDIITYIPADLQEEVELKEFADLNSIVISGSVPQTEDLINFFEKIDQLVPVIAIDIIIVDYRKNRSITTGISAGLGTEPSGPTTGTILPDANFNFSAASINNVIENINEGSAVNLGKVTPNFNLSIQALETDGALQVRSTPKLATLNGHEAKLSIGNTEYYVVESNNVIGAQNPQNIITRNFESVDADLNITITPFVSGNDQITLNISVEQSDFTERISDEAPPGTVTRNFTSTLRVRNNEVVLLGGLEEKSRNDSGSGLPFIARIPVLKWIFGRRTRSRSTTQMNIFIKPTVIY